MSIDVIRRPYLNIGLEKRVYLDDLDLQAVELKDLALALSHENRYGGHTDRGFSVLEHLLLADWIYRRECDEHVVPAHRECRLAILMHDAHEALCKDMPSPLKKILPDYQALEARIETALWDHYGIVRVMERWSQNVKFYDLRALNTERKHFGFEPDGDADWPSLDTWVPACMIDFLWDIFRTQPITETREEALQLLWTRTVNQLLQEVSA